MKYRPVEVFFNKPGSPFNKQLLIRDILASQIIVGIASAWFTDTDIAQALIDSLANVKCFIVSQADMNRPGTSQAFQMLSAYEVKSRGNGHMIRSAIVGSSDFREGIMHHKFVVVDHAVWTGSYNLTYQAQKNYENILRIEDPFIFESFVHELDSLYSCYVSQKQNSTFYCPTFYCPTCDRELPNSEQYNDSSSNPICKNCVKSF